MRSFPDAVPVLGRTRCDAERKGASAAHSGGARRASSMAPRDKGAPRSCHKFDKLPTDASRSTPADMLPAREEGRRKTRGRMHTRATVLRRKWGDASRQNIGALCVAAAFMILGFVLILPVGVMGLDGTWMMLTSLYTTRRWHLRQPHHHHRHHRCRRRHHRCRRLLHPRRRRRRLHPRRLTIAGPQSLPPFASVSAAATTTVVWIRQPVVQ